MEIDRGCDGAWVAHPGLVSPIKDLFEERLGGDNQVSMIPEGDVTEDMLLDTSNAGESESIIISIIPNIEINAGVALTVGAGKTMVIDALQIGDL